MNEMKIDLVLAKTSHFLTYPLAVAVGRTSRTARTHCLALRIFAGFAALTILLPFTLIGLLLKGIFKCIRSNHKAQRISNIANHVFPPPQNRPPILNLPKTPAPADNKPLTPRVDKEALEKYLADVEQSPEKGSIAEIDALFMSVHGTTDLVKIDRIATISKLGYSDSPAFVAYRICKIVEKDIPNIDDTINQELRKSRVWGSIFNCLAYMCKAEHFPILVPTMIHNSYHATACMHQILERDPQEVFAFCSAYWNHVKTEPSLLNHFHLRLSTKVHFEKAWESLLETSFLDPWLQQRAINLFITNREFINWKSHPWIDEMDATIRSMFEQRQASTLALGVEIQTALPQLSAQLGSIILDYATDRTLRLPSVSPKMQERIQSGKKLFDGHEEHQVQAYVEGIYSELTQDSKRRDELTAELCFYAYAMIQSGQFSRYCHLFTKQHQDKEAYRSRTNNQQVHDLQNDVGCFLIEFVLHNEPQDDFISFFDDLFKWTYYENGKPNGILASRDGKQGYFGVHSELHFLLEMFGVRRLTEKNSRAIPLLLVYATLRQDHNSWQLDYTELSQYVMECNEQERLDYKRWVAQISRNFADEDLKQVIEHMPSALFGTVASEVFRRELNVELAGAFFSRFWESVKLDQIFPVLQLLSNIELFYIAIVKCLQKVRDNPFQREKCLVIAEILRTNQYKNKENQICPAGIPASLSDEMRLFCYQRAANHVNPVVDSPPKK